MGHRVGIDLVAISDVVAAHERHGDRYLGRVFTSEEIASCTRGSAIHPPALAGCFAVKEATRKALAPSTEGMSWHATALAADGTLRLSGPAAALAREAGLERWSVDVAQAGPYALAVVLGRAA